MSSIFELEQFDNFILDIFNVKKITKTIKSLISELKELIKNIKLENIIIISNKDGYRIQFSEQWQNQCMGM